VDPGAGVGALLLKQGNGPSVEVSRAIIALESVSDLTAPTPEAQAQLLMNQNMARMAVTAKSANAYRLSFSYFAQASR